MGPVDADVAIVGYGPVGNTLAILLGQLGHRVTVIERWPQPYALPRAVHMDHEVVRELAGLPVRDLGFFYDWLIVDVVLDEPRAFDPINLQICDPVRPTTAVSGGPGRRRWEFICVPDPVEAAARDEAMAAAVTAEPADAPSLPGLDCGVLHPTAPHAGDLFAQGTVDGRPFDDVHGAGWRLLVVDIDASLIDPAARAWFESIGGRVVPLHHPDPVYGGWFARHDTAAALQRPDFHLYGTAPTAAGASALLADLRHHLKTPAMQGAPA